MGQKLRLHNQTLARLGWYNISYLTDKSGPVVMATAASHNHFDESLDLIGSIQKHYPNSTIVYTDLGLSQFQIYKVTRIIY